MGAPTTLQRSIDAVTWGGPLSYDFGVSDVLDAAKKKLAASAWAALANGYNRLKTMLELLGQIQFPALPTTSSTKADWADLFKCWFYETKPAFPGANWQTDDHVVFSESSPFSGDLARCPGMMEVKTQFLASMAGAKLLGSWRPNPWKGAFKFTLGGSSVPNYYTIVEWFMGSFYVTANWIEIKPDVYELQLEVDNMSDWHSATRLPKSWQEKIEKSTGMKVEDLMGPAPRGQVGDLRLKAILTELAKKIPGGLATLPLYLAQVPHLPSYGGNFTQKFHMRVIW